ncbi:MAG: hypothetical protein JXR77_19710 [Lentisphaeria bacterium]|nr:hypothetical protein [Lentisphaeria bacterium]
MVLHLSNLRGRLLPAPMVLALCTVFLFHGGRVVSGQEAPMTLQTATVPRYANVAAMKSAPGLRAGDVVETAGFRVAGDGGGALYRLEVAVEDRVPNEADVLAVAEGLVAVLREGEAVNYRMFGAVSDGEEDDGVAIQRAHEYANREGIPVINRSGEFWIRQTNSIPIGTNVHWGSTRFHIDERYNSRRSPRFVVLNDEPARDLTSDAELKAALLAGVRPGVQLIAALAPYAGHLFVVADAQDRIGIRAGPYSKQGWAREELFYVEEEGRILGDIAWEFKDFTSIKAIPCGSSYRLVEGGGFHFSGDSPEDGSESYHHHGIAIQRSRTLIRDQWMGLEKGHRDESMAPRCGFYVLGNVYDVTLENIRAMPWEKNRREKDRVVGMGTYGIGGARMLNCTFRNMTAEGGWVAWGFFGTNLNKNFRIENCRLNRVDVHFHCWNLHIRDSVIGFKGISVTGGGDLTIENTVRHGNSFVSFRRDYGAKWDGHIRLRGCTLRPSSTGGVSVLQYSMADFDHAYPVGFGRSVAIEDLRIDYSAAADNTAPCWLMDIAPFSRTQEGARLFFPRSVIFRNVTVEGRRQGVRLLRVPNPHGYDLRREGGLDGGRLTANCTLVCDSVQLERLVPGDPGDLSRVHLLVGGPAAADYADGLALYPEIRFRDCRGVSVYLGNCVASAFFDRCSLNTVTAPGLRGELAFRDCRFQPEVGEVPEWIYSVDGALGTRFSNCTVHAPVVGGVVTPGMVNRTGFLEINGAVRHAHVNTTLGKDILDYCREQGTVLTPDFIARLKAHHALEE